MLALDYLNKYIADRKANLEKVENNRKDYHFANEDHYQAWHKSANGDIEHSEQNKKDLMRAAMTGVPGELILYRSMTRTNPAPWRVEFHADHPTCLKAIYDAIGNAVMTDETHSGDGTMVNLEVWQLLVLVDFVNASHKHYQQ